jgi:U3 small nucleolar RNA-associated protein 7
MVKFLHTYTIMLSIYMVTSVLTLFPPYLLRSLLSAIDREGRYMTTAGLDSMVKIWDLRMFKCLHSYTTSHPAMSLDVSDTGLIAMAVGRSVEVLKDAFMKPTDLTYLKHTVRTPNAALSSGGGSTASTRFLASSIQTMSVKFRPYEDVLAVGHTHGLSTVIVPGKNQVHAVICPMSYHPSLHHPCPNNTNSSIFSPSLNFCFFSHRIFSGSGEANYDSFESNPFQNAKQRQEQEVQTLLQKLSHEMIGLDASFVAAIDKGEIR